MELEKKLLEQLQLKLDKNQLVLPSMPDIMIKVKKIIDDPDSSLEDLCRAISQDPSLAARILKVSNNALYKGHQEISNLQMAVSRLGLNLVKTLVTSHVLTQMFSQPSGILKPYFSDMQSQSANIAANAYVICKTYSKLHPDDALLSGLVVNIGFLPMGKCVETFPETKKDPTSLLRAMNAVSPEVTKRILENWHFPKHIIDAAIHSRKPERNGGAELDLTDILCIARLNIYRGSNHKYAQLDWSKFPAFQKIGIKSAEDINKLDEISEEIASAKEMLGAR